MSKRVPKIVEAVYESGVFRPVRRVRLPDRSRVNLTLVPVSTQSSKAQGRLVARQRKALLSLAGIGRSGRSDISENPHTALYGTTRAR
jgi:predicted DNA-binding antitoxin AbrB/MazE fold protein